MNSLYSAGGIQHSDLSEMCNSSNPGDIKKKKNGLLQI